MEGKIFTYPISVEEQLIYLLIHKKWINSTLNY